MGGDFWDAGRPRSEKPACVLYNLTVFVMVIDRVSPNLAYKRKEAKLKRNFLMRNSETDPLVLLVSL